MYVCILPKNILLILDSSAAQYGGLSGSNDPEPMEVDASEDESGQRSSEQENLEQGTN